ncbi:MAG TPA: tyrosine-type recombinase/integrase [Vicinamibacterales bacterium]|nr:tyrosine-type recombinase/integrase [Vicinamibacterales bacterium]
MLRDLRHEAASRFEEAGVLTTDVSKFLGHRNLSTTTRYLNTTSR